ncbi:Probable diguanylate cyclase YfiN [Cedecea lapagei]|uniref:diguanylate cyclase n=1 Tax=Cedecea lapagei TaxID=158823 RepID=A0A3S5DPI7_9ENTR|nr:diguanylate cyclase DgcN [Cedecea lapagei]VEB95743.1 Probable diguanylate cyclase YfiN [Cedecea lapagei]
MNKDLTASSRPTFKGTLRRISIISVVIAMLIVWLLLSVASMLTLKQYAQKNLQLLAVTVSHSLEAAVVFRDGAAANDTLALLGKQGQFTAAKVVDSDGQELTHWQAEKSSESNMVGGLVTRWLYPHPIRQPIWHNGKIIGEMHLTGTDATVTLFVWLSLGVLTACIVLASIIALGISRHLHGDIDAALQNITDVVHDVRSNRNFSRRVLPEKIEEFHLFAQDFNSLLDEMEEWQRQLQLKNASLQKSALQDPLTGLANRAAFRTKLNKLIEDTDKLRHSALLFMDGDNFKFINDTWGHAAGDAVLIEVARRLLAFANDRYLAFRLGGDEFAMLLNAVSTQGEAEAVLKHLKEMVEQPILLPGEQRVTMTLSIGVALAKDITSAESLMETADRNMYIEKHKQRELPTKQHQKDLS